MITIVISIVIIYILAHVFFPIIGIIFAVKGVKYAAKNAPQIVKSVSDSVKKMPEPEQKSFTKTIASVVVGAQRMQQDIASEVEKQKAQDVIKTFEKCLDKSASERLPEHGSIPEPSSFVNLSRLPEDKKLPKDAQDVIHDVVRICVWFFILAGGLSFIMGPIFGAIGWLCCTTSLIGYLV